MHRLENELGRLISTNDHLEFLFLGHEMKLPGFLKTFESQDIVKFPLSETIRRFCPCSVHYLLDQLPILKEGATEVGAADDGVA